MKTLSFLLIILFSFGACGPKSNPKNLDPNRTYVSVFKSGNEASGPCDSCLVLEINDFSIYAVLSPSNPTVETCNEDARYLSDGNDLLNFPTSDGASENWSISKQSGSGDGCFPDQLTVVVTRESSNRFTFFFSNSSNLSEYIMVKQ